VSRDELVASFLDTDRREASALLAVIAAYTADDVLRARIQRELLLRLHTLPDWLTRLGEIEVYRTVEMVHVLGDGDNVFLGLRFPTGDELSVVVYIDHNVGTLVKDAYVVPAPIAELITLMRAASHDDPDTGWNDIDPADARARITDAIEVAAITYPPFETETWPSCRPLVEWVTRLLPEGGRGYERQEWSDADVAALADRFFASPLGAGLGDADHRSLLQSILWFGTDYGPGDPMRWSPVAVEILLLDWIPRKIVADARYLANVPELLRAFLTFCHRERGIRAALTAEALGAVDEYEPEYLEIIASPRPQGPAALLAAMGMLEPDEPWYEGMLDTLRDAVGGDDALQALDTPPLPDEDFSWHGIPGDVHARVAEVLMLCDGCCEALLDVEYRTACRRFLAVAASGDPDIFRRTARAETAAAAVCWVVGKANDLFTPRYSGNVLVKDVMAHFGLQGSVSQRATTLLKAGGFPGEFYGRIPLASPDYLVSSRCQRIVADRERYQAMREN
jgi:hypothetical protein